MRSLSGIDAPDEGSARVRPEELAFEVGDDEAGRRLDVVLVARVAGMSRARARDLVAAGKVRVNGRRARKGGRLATGDRVALEELPASSRFAAEPDDTITLAVLYEDGELVVVDKPAGMPSHPLRADERGTVASALVARYPEMAGVGYSRREPGIVHRLDTSTSGVMLAARDSSTFDALVLAIKAGKMDKRYMALVHGGVTPQIIDAPIRPHPHNARRVEVLGADANDQAHAREATTEILSAELIGADRTLVEVRASVATRHQIRAHLAFIGHPLVGDVLYGAPEEPILSRHFLHASSIALAHPVTEERLHVESPLPGDLASFVDALRP